MKYRLYLLIFIAFIFCSSNSAQAGFVVKKQAAMETSTTAKTLTNGSATLSDNKEHRSHLFSTVRNLAHPLFGYKRRPSEWVGIVAMISGLVGLFAPGVNFIAILFGILGMSRNCKTKGLALAGFILGMLEMVLYLLVGATFVSLILL